MSAIKNDVYTRCELKVLWDDENRLSRKRVLAPGKSLFKDEGLWEKFYWFSSRSCEIFMNEKAMRVRKRANVKKRFSARTKLFNERREIWKLDVINRSKSLSALCQKWTLSGSKNKARTLKNSRFGGHKERQKKRKTRRERTRRCTFSSFTQLFVAEREKLSKMWKMLCNCGAAAMKCELRRRQRNKKIKWALAIEQTKSASLVATARDEHKIKVDELRSRKRC